MNLCYGEGSYMSGRACWMSALGYYIGENNNVSWDDSPSCVHDEIRRWCILINDECDDDAVRERVIGPYLFDPLGTARVSDLDKRARLCLMIDRLLPERVRQLKVTMVFPPIRDTTVAREVVEGLQAQGLWGLFSWAGGSSYLSDVPLGLIRRGCENADKKEKERFLSIAAKAVSDACSIGTRKEVAPMRTKEDLFEFLS